MPSPVSTEAPADAQVPSTGLGVRGISLAYHPSHPIIEDLSTAITPGSVTMIVGPNACGKSTLLRAMSRVLSPTSGRGREGPRSRPGGVSLPNVAKVRA